MIVDTGVLFALIDSDDRHHDEAREIFARPDAKIVPEPVVVETDWLLQHRLGVVEDVAFLRSLGEGAVAIESTTTADRDRAADLIEQYASLRLGYVDAVTIAMSERLRDPRIATLDRRHFTVVRPSHVDAFEIVP